LKAIDPNLHYELVKQVISYSLDQNNEAREAASKFLAEFSGAEIRTDQVIKGFTILFQRVEDLVLDVPDILKLLSSFLGRAVTDEAIPPSLLGRIDLSPQEMGSQVITATKELLSGPRPGLRLSTVWLPRQQLRSLSEISQASEEDDKSSANSSGSAGTPNSGTSKEKFFEIKKSDSKDNNTTKQRSLSEKSDKLDKGSGKQRTASEKSEGKSTTKAKIEKNTSIKSDKTGSNEKLEKPKSPGSGKIEKIPDKNKQQQKTETEKPKSPPGKTEKPKSPSSGKPEKNGKTTRKKNG